MVREPLVHGTDQEGAKILGNVAGGSIVLRSQSLYQQKSFVKKIRSLVSEIQNLPKHKLSLSWMCLEIIVPLKDGEN